MTKVKILPANVFIVAYALTIADATLTAIGVSCGFIYEKNILLRSAMAISPVLTASTICAYVGALLYIAYRARVEAAAWLPYAMAFMIWVKVSIIGMHFLWISTII